jgi:tetratricopeptide (TPR) repeat protein
MGAKAEYNRVMQLDPRTTEAFFEEIVVCGLMQDYIAGPGVTNAVLAFQFMPVAQVIVESRLAPNLNFSQQGPVKQTDIDVDSSAMSPLLRGARAVHFMFEREVENEPNPLERAEDYARDALKQKPKCGWIAAVLAQVLVKRNRAAEALTLLEENRDYTGVSASMRGWAQGLALENLDKTVEADAAFSAIKYPPFSVLARDERGYMWRRKGDLEASMAVYQNASPASIVDGFLHGRMLWCLGKETEAAKVLDESIDCIQQGGYIVALYRASRWPEMAIKLALFTQRDPEGAMSWAPEIRGLRARIAARGGDAQRADSEAARIREPFGLRDLERQGVNTEWIRAHWKCELGATEGTFALLQGDLKKARGLYDDAIAGAPDVFPGDAHLDRATLYEKLGDRSAAIAACESASQIDPMVFGPLAKKRIAELSR